MDPDLATRMFEVGGNLILIGMPEGNEFGIDYNSWTTGPRFKGVKMIPPGLHFVYFSSVSAKEGMTGVRDGFFHWFQEREILVRKWNSQTECVEVDDTLTATFAERGESLREIERYLGPFPMDESMAKWRGFTRFASSRRVYDALFPDDSGALSSITYTEIPRRLPSSGSVAGEDVTRVAMDNTPILQHISRTRYGGDDKCILGELQVAFVAFLIGQSFDAFERWKGLVKLLGFSESAIRESPALFFDFIEVIHFQMKEIPSDFFVDAMSRENFLSVVLRRFFSSLDPSTTEATLYKRAIKFRVHISREFQFDFGDEEEDDADAPTIVSESELNGLSLDD